MGFKEGYLCGGTYKLAQKDSNAEVMEQLEKDYDFEGLSYRIGFLIGKGLRGFRDK